MQKVVWLDIHADPPREHTRTFATWREAEKFIIRLTEKYPIPVLVSETEEK